MIILRSGTNSRRYCFNHRIYSGAPSTYTGITKAKRVINTDCIEKRLLTIRIIEFMDRYPCLSERLQLEDVSYYPQRPQKEEQ